MPVTVLQMLPVLLGLAFLLYLVVNSIARAWLDYRIKITLLKEVERKPELLRESDELRGLLERPEAGSGGPCQDLSLTGAILALFGLLTLFVAEQFSEARWVAGAYLGGLICVPVGFLLSVVGLFVRFLQQRPGKLPFPNDPPPPDA